MIGFMSTTAFLSMWISNSAATAMMLPISKAVLQQLCETEALADERELAASMQKVGQEDQALELDDTFENHNQEAEANSSSRIIMGVCVCVRESILTLWLQFFTHFIILIFTCWRFADSEKGIEDKDDKEKHGTLSKFCLNLFLNLYQAVWIMWIHVDQWISHRQKIHRKLCSPSACLDFLRVIFLWSSLKFLQNSKEPECLGWSL